MSVHPFPSPPLRAQLVASRDLLDLGESMCLAGSAINSVGTHILHLHEPPTDMMLTEAATAASRVLSAVLALRVGRALATYAVELPSDTEGSE